MRGWILFLACWPSWVVGQGALFSPNQQLVETAMRGGMFIVRQDYQLVDSVTGQRFGRGGKTMFGGAYVVGVKVRGGYLLPERGAHPWEGDSLFAPYRKTHVPVRSKGYYKELTDSCLRELPEGVWTTAGEGIYRVADSVVFGGEGFAVDETVGQKNGWFVWMVADYPLRASDTMSGGSCVVYRKSLTITDGRRTYAVEAPEGRRQVWGGVFVVPERTGVGVLTFRLCGLLERGERGWQLRTFGREEQRDVSGELTPVEEEGMDEQHES